MSRRTFTAVAALVSLVGCRSTQSIYRTPEVEADIMNAYLARLAGWPVRYERRYLGTSYGVAHVLVSGPEGGEPVLMLHAMGLTATMWRDTVAELARTRRVYCLDYIGDLGASRLYSLDEYPGDGPEVAAFLAEVMDRLGIDQADLVGASFGGWAAMNLAVHRPERVGRVALLGPMGIAPVTAGVVARLTSLKLFPTTAKKRAMVAWTLGDDERVRQEFEPYLMAAMNAENRIAIPMELPDRDLRRIRAPVLLVLGENDGPVGPPAKSADRAQALVPDLEVLVLPGTGHLLSVERREVVNEQLVRFFSGSPEAASTR